MVREWSDDYLIGVEEVDAQHRAFFDAAQSLYDNVIMCKGETAVEEALSFLRKYAAEHFTTEEALMEKQGYPGVAEHKQLHAEFMEKLDGFADELDMDGTPTQNLGDEIQEMTQGWLIEHITHEDIQYVKHGSK